MANTRPQVMRGVVCYKDSDDFKKATASKSETVQLLAEPRVRKFVSNLSSYCSSLPADDESSQECWSAYQYLMDELEKGPTKLRTYDDWVDFVKESEVEGAANTIQVLTTLKKAVLHDVESMAKTSIEFNKDRRRQDFLEFFKTMDKDGDGRLNIEEFRSIMKELGDELHGPMVETILQAVSSNYGFVEFDEFMAVVEAEEIRSHSKLATLMRQSTSPQQQNWWSS